jgi:hypothetical protein
MISLFTALCLNSPLFVSPAHAGAVESSISQAENFLRRGWIDDAIDELKLAIGTADGEISFEAHSILARVMYETRDAEAALHYARIAERLAMNPTEAAEMNQLADYIDSAFGVVVINPPYPGMTSFLELESITPVLDPELREFIDEVALAWSDSTLLPVRIALPNGGYLINGHEIRATAGSEAVVDLPMGSIGSAGFAALQVSRLELSTGTSVLLSERGRNLRPSFELQVAVTQPVGDWLIGATIDWSLRGFSVAGTKTGSAPYAVNTGVRVGREVMVGGPLAIQPSIGYRIGSLPGIELACVASSANGEFTGPYTCQKPVADQEADLHVYEIATTHALYSELSVSYRRSGKTTASGVGIKLVSEYFIGGIPESGQANFTNGDAGIEYILRDPNSDAGVSGLNLRMLASFSYAF